MTDSLRSNAAPPLTPEGIFVVHLRSDSEILGQRLCGRVEHVKSGDCKRFASLADLLAFMANHSAPGGVELKGNGDANP